MIAWDVYSIACLCASLPVEAQEVGQHGLIDFHHILQTGQAQPLAKAVIQMAAGCAA